MLLSVQQRCQRDASRDSRRDASRDSRRDASSDSSISSTTHCLSAVVMFVVPEQIQHYSVVPYRVHIPESVS